MDEQQAFELLKDLIVNHQTDKQIKILEEYCENNLSQGYSSHGIDRISECLRIRKRMKKK